MASRINTHANTYTHVHLYMLTHAHIHTHTCSHIHTRSLIHTHTYTTRLDTQDELLDSVSINVSLNGDPIRYTFTNLNGGTHGVTVSAISRVDDQTIKGQPSQLVTFTVGKTKAFTC